MKKNIIITFFIIIGIVVLLSFPFLKDRWFKEKVRDGKYTVIGTIICHNFLDDSIIDVSIRIKDNATNKYLIRYDSVIKVYASRNPRSDNYSIECTDEYIAIRLISDDEMEYIKDKEIMRI